MSLVNPFTQPGKWYKANLHTHTTASDGTQTLTQRVEGYRKSGYHILAITDHHLTNDVRGLSSRSFLVVSGMEFHPFRPGTKDIHHLVALNVPHGFSFTDKFLKDGNACIKAVKKAGGESILAHPNWCGHRYDMYSYLKGYLAVEIYNTACDRMARGESDTDWNQLLDSGQILPAVAVDDSHHDEDLYQGYSLFRMSKLTLECFMAALRSGCYYSSTRPSIRDFRIDKGKVVMSCSPAVKIYLNPQTGHGARKLAAPGKRITRLTFPVNPQWKYIRAVVIDERGNKAWTNPIALKFDGPARSPRIGGR
jgi:hypothetical protein